MKKLVLFSFLILTQVVGFSQVLTISIAEHRFRIDPYNHIIVVQSDSIENYTGLSAYEEIDLSLNNIVYPFAEIPDNLQYTSSYEVNNGSNDFQLFFTQLPLLKIQSSTNISSQTKIPAQFLYADNDQILIATIGIEFRGNISQSFPKKSYDIEFWEDASTETSVDVQFGNLRSDDDWVLDGLYNEPLRLRSHVSSELWLDIHQPYYAQEEPNARSGAGGFYVELFLNGKYSGIYLLSEQIDRKLLKIKDFNGNIRGELFKGKQNDQATNFLGLPNFDNSSQFWGGFEIKYPKVADTTDWQNIYNFVDFVVNSSDADFTGIWDKFNYQNYLDYFIFLNLTRAADNTGKNIYIAKYDSVSPYFYVPWDLDGTFGLKWDGTYWNITDDILTNGFMDRVIDTDVGNYTEDVNARWAELRQSVLNTDYVIDRFEYSYNLLKANNVYTREALVFPNYPFDQESLDYIETWIQERMAFLDIYFGYEPVGISKKNKTILRFYPNPVSDELYLLNTDDYANKPYQFFDIQGKIVKEGIFDGHSIIVSKIQPGFYFLSMDDLREKIVVR